MTTDDYAPAVRGGLKLKGSKPSGVVKNKKKKKAKDPSTTTSADAEKAGGESSSAIQKALEDEDAATRQRSTEEGGGLSEHELRDLEKRDHDGKTAAEKAYEEMRKKRVSPCRAPLLDPLTRARKVSFGSCCPLLAIKLLFCVKLKLTTHSSSIVSNEKAQKRINNGSRN
jgi:protein FAM32A